MGPYIYVERRYKAERRWLNARRLLLFAAVPLMAAMVLSPKVASADQVAGIPTTGCFGAVGYGHNLYRGSASGVANIAISYRLTLNGTVGGTATVVQAGWTLSPQGAQWETNFWSSNNAMASTSMFIDPTGRRLVNLEAGTTGMLTYTAILRGYSADACFSISDVKVLINRVNTPGGGQTAPPGGGGFASPTPTAPGATPTPTVPPNPTYIPGATPGPGVQCFRDWAGVERCYPQPPPGYCYMSGLGNSGDGQLVECESATNPPPPADPTTCAGMSHDFCFAWGPVTSSIGGGGSTIGTITDWDAGLGETVFAGGWTVISISSGTGFGGAKYLAGSGASGCTFTGTWTGEGWMQDLGINGQNPTVSYVRNMDMTTGTKKTVTTANLTVGQQGQNWGGSCSNSSNDKSVNINITVGSPCGGCTFSASGVFFADLGDAGPGATQPPPSASPTATIPSNYWGGGGAPSFNIDIDVDVDICEDDPRIIACQYSFPPMSVDLCASDPTIQACATPRGPLPTQGAEGPGSTWFGGQVDALSSGLREKAPFGYVDQVGTAFSDAAANAVGAELDLSFPMPVFAPEGEAGGSHDIEVEIPLADMTAPLIPFRPVLLFLLMAAVAIRLLKIALAAVGAAGGASKDGEEG